MKSEPIEVSAENIIQNTRIEVYDVIMNKIYYVHIY